MYFTGRFKVYGIVLLLIASGSVLLGVDPVMDGKGLITISSRVDIFDDRIYDDDVVITSTGHLFIHEDAILRLGSGHKIQVNGGMLTIKGRYLHKAELKMYGGKSIGVVADEDAKITVEYGRLYGMMEGIRLEGTGHSGSSGYARINNSVFNYCDKGVVMMGTTLGTAPYDFLLEDNVFSGNKEDIVLGYSADGVEISNNEMYRAEEASVRVVGCDDVKIASNYFEGCANGTICGLLNGIDVYNNSFYNCTTGSLFGLIYNVSCHNNSYRTNIDGIKMDSFDNALVENNNIFSMGKYGGLPFFAVNGDGLTVRNNILSGRLLTMTIENPMTSSAVHDNYLTNMTTRDFMDLDGDGYCDENPYIPGTAGMIAKNSRTGVVNLDKEITETYVNPVQAVRYGSGNGYKILSQFDDIGPQMGIRKMVIHNGNLEIGRPLELVGDDASGCNFKPDPMNPGIHVKATDHVRLYNLSLLSGANGVTVSDSKKITCENLVFRDLFNQMESRMLVRGSRDVSVESTYVYSSLGNPFMVVDGYNVSIKNSILYFSKNPGVLVLNSDKTNLENLHFNGQYKENLIIRDSTDTVVRECQIHNHVDNDLLMMIDNSQGTVIDDTVFYISDMIHQINEDITLLLLTGNTDGTRIHGSSFNYNQWYPTPDASLEGIKIVGSSNTTAVDECSFRNLESGLELFDDPYYPHHADGFTVQNCTFQGDELGMSAALLGNMTVQGCTFTDCEESLGMFQGDFTVRDNVFSNFDMGAGQLGGTTTFVNNRMVNGTTGYWCQMWSMGMPNLKTLNNTMLEMKTGYQMGSCAFELNSDHINGSEASLKCRDTAESLVNHSVLDSDTPVFIESSVIGQVVSVELRNCTGEYTDSDVPSPLCFANWTWPLTVEIYDELKDPLSAGLHIESSSAEEVFSGTVPGYYHNPGILGYSHTDQGGDLTMNDYLVRAEEGGDSREDYVNMTSPQHLAFQFNHQPTVNITAPAELTMEEDSTLDEDVSGWFIDRDQLDISIESMTGDNISASLSGDVLSLIPGENWSGKERLTLIAVDTFGESTTHEVLINVTPVNDAPVLIEEVPELETEEDRSVWIDLEEYVFDVDGDALTYGNGSVDNCTTQWDSGNVTISPVENWFGIIEIPITVSDGSEELSLHLIVNVTPVNDPPEWIGEDPLHVDVEAGKETDIDISQWILDVDDPLGGMDVTADSDHVTYSQGILTMEYPVDSAPMTEDVGITVSDGEYSCGFILNVTVSEPPSQWGIDEVNVTVDPETGDWTVEVEGNEGEDIWVVVEGPDGRKSYRLNETSPGHYEGTIPGSRFQPGEDYTYHFSDTEDGDDLTGGQFGGEITQPEPAGGEGDDDDTDGETDNFWLIIIILVLVVLAVVVYMYQRSKAKEDILDTEE